MEREELEAEDQRRNEELRRRTAHQLFLRPSPSPTFRFRKLFYVLKKMILKRLNTKSPQVRPDLTFREKVKAKKNKNLQPVIVFICRSAQWQEPKNGVLGSNPAA